MEEAVGRKNLRAATFMCEIRTFHLLEMIPFPASTE